MKVDIIRAWKDDLYWQSLSDEQKAALPENPVGSFELADTDLMNIYGGNQQLQADSFYCNSFHGGCGNPNSSFNGGCNSFHGGCGNSFNGGCSSFNGGCSSFNGGCSSFNGGCGNPNSSFNGGCNSFNGGCGNSFNGRCRQ